MTILLENLLNEINFANGKNLIESRDDHAMQFILKNRVFFGTINENFTDQDKEDLRSMGWRIRTNIKTNIEDYYYRFSENIDV